MDVTHLYGLTETFGPAAICEWRGEWNRSRSSSRRRSRRARASATCIRAGAARGRSARQGRAADARVLEEIALRGNNVMGVLSGEIATRRAITLRMVSHRRFGRDATPTAIFEIKAAPKDIIVSGGEKYRLDRDRAYVWPILR